MKKLLNISDLNKEDFLLILKYAGELKENFDESLSNKHIGLIFEKNSTRTRLSFQVGIKQLGGNYIDIKLDELNLQRLESFEDTFEIMSCYLDALVFRTNKHHKLEVAYKYFQKPIINALSDISHPCQAISDLLTLKEHFGTLNLHILWMGDMNNVCFSLAESLKYIDNLKLTICSPSSIILKNKWRLTSNIELVDEISKVKLKDISCIMTDVFISMNDENNNSKIELLKPYQVDLNLLSQTSENCIFMHCLPAKVGLEVTEDVFRSDKSIIWKQAFNRMIAQKRLLQLIYSK